MINKNLSAQFDFISEPKTTIKKNVKVRNKKIKERQEYDILQLDNQIKTCFIIEQSKIEEYKKQIISMLEYLSNLTIPFGVEDNIILDIHGMVKKYLIPINCEIIENGNSFNKSERRLNKQSNQLSCEILTYREFLNFYQELKRLITKTENIESGNLYDKYISLTESLISQYKTILSIPKKTSFLAKTKIKDINEDKKTELLDSYIKIASNFIDLEYSKDTPIVEQICICKCGNSDEFEITEGMNICEHCGLEISTISCQTSFKDIDRINMHQKYKYEKKSHFKEGCLQFQGKQNKYINPSLYDKANKWLDIHGLINHETEIKRDKYSKVRKDHIRLFMSESQDPKITSHYEDLNLIHSQLTGEPCPDISHLEEKLYAQFEKLVEAFLAIDDIDRTNFLNSQFVLKKLLLLNGYKVEKHTFPGLKTLQRQLEHEICFEKLINFAGIQPSVE
jgi:hypothetical protein